MEDLKPEGKCVYCEQVYSGRGIGRHLSTHLRKLESEDSVKNKSFHLKVTGGGGLFFLHLLMHEHLSLADLDAYLRAIWLECCGHMSSFEIKGAKRAISWDFDDMEFGIDMKKKIGKVLKKDMLLEYDYDFGSTTRLEVKVQNAYRVANSEGIVLLSRNEPLKILCDLCGKQPAEVLCTVCYGAETTFCKKCSTKHARKCEDFADYSALEIVNSPRAGVCAYDGGRIDVERDGVWQG